MAPKVKGRATIRSAAILFLVSAIVELLSLSGEVPLFGGVRTGIGAMAYHLAFVLLYSMIGIGLWAAKPWGYRIVIAGSVLYSLDKIQLLLTRDTLYAYIMQQLTVTKDVVAMLPKNQLLNYFTAGYSGLVLCWWGFAFYIHMRRGYFYPNKVEKELSTV